MRHDAHTQLGVAISLGPDAILNHVVPAQPVQVPLAHIVIFNRRARGNDLFVFGRAADVQPALGLEIEESAA